MPVSSDSSELSATRLVRLFKTARANGCANDLVRQVNAILASWLKRDGCLPPDVIDDILQDTWTRLFTNPSLQFENDARLIAWLKRVAGNLRIDHFRGLRPTVALNEIDAASALPEREDPRMVALQHCLAELEKHHPEFHEVFLACAAAADKTDLATALQIALNTVYSRYKRAIEFLRRCIGKAIGRPFGGSPS